MPTGPCSVFESRAISGPGQAEPVSPAPSGKDARRFTRYPIALSVCFETNGTVRRRKSGAGITRNLSSRGIFIETKGGAPPGTQVKIIAEWPVLLEGTIPLQFVALGEVIRRDARGFAMRILRYEYRTRRKSVSATLSDPRSASAGYHLVSFSPPG
jgi:hypothetical protein